MFVEQKQLFHWRRAKHNKREVAYCTRLLVGGMMILSAVGGVVQAGPTGETLAGGFATFDRPDANTTNINQTTSRVDINWTGFDTTAGETVNFNQPSELAVAINRISGARTQFDGTLNANGRIFLINQNGLTFGGSAAVNVGALLVTTSKLELDDQFQTEEVSASGISNGPFVFTTGEGGPDRSIVNNGRITIASPGGFAVLVAPNVTNNGVIENGANAPMVQIELASAGSFTMNADLRGDGLITYAVEPEVFDDNSGEGGGDGVTGVTNNGTLQARSGTIYVSAHMASEIVNGVVNLNGIVDADQFVSTQDGEVFAAAVAEPGPAQPGGQIHVASVGDINIGGGADIHAMGGDYVRADFSAADDINMGTADSPAKITLKGVNDVHNADHNGDGESDAELNMTAGTDGSGSLRINGDIDVSAENTSLGSSAGQYAGAEAEANLSAANDVTITTGNGPIRVSAVADNVVGSYADADATLNIMAGTAPEGSGGDLNITGGVEVTATGVSSTSTAPNIIPLEDAEGEASATLSGDNVTIAGDLLVSGSATVNGSDANHDDALGSAELDVTAKTGDLNITGDVSVLADASLSNRGSYAGADASASLNAAGDVNITTDTSTIKVASVATGATNGSYSDADATLNISANTDNTDGGDLTITGDIEVTADGTGLASTAEGEAQAGLSGDSVTINGNVKVAGTGLVNASGDDGEDALGSARISIFANDGDLNITGDVYVMGKGHVTGNYDGTGSAEASADLSGRNVTIDGDVTVGADALASGVDEDVYDADARTDLKITAWGEDGDLSITGDIRVDAKAVRSGSYASDATAFADASLSAGRDISVGNIAVTGVVENGGGESDYTRTRSTLRVSAGQSGTGSLDINGDVAVRASAQVDKEGSSTGSATASAEMFAADNITIRGDTTVEAISANNGSHYDAEANASLNIDAGANNEASTGGNLDIAGDVTVRSDARVTNPDNRYGDAIAKATARLVADDDVTIAGDTTVTAQSNMTGSRPRSAESLAGLTVLAGTRTTPPVAPPVQDTALDGRLTAQDAPAASPAPADLTITGNVKVQAGATTNGSTATADANAILAASGNVKMAGDIDVDASAKATSQNDSTGYGPGSALANAALQLTGGVVGNLEGVDASQDNLADSMAKTSEDAVKSGDVGDYLQTLGADIPLGSGGVDFTGDIHVAATSDLNVTGEAGGSGEGSGQMASGFSQATAAAFIVGGGDVSLDTDPVVINSNARANYQTSDGSGNTQAFMDTESVSSLLIASGLDAAGADSPAAGNLDLRGDMVANAQQSATVDGVENPQRHDELAAAITALYARGDLAVTGADPLANADGAARVQQKTTAYQMCVSGNCDPVTGGLADYDGTIVPDVSEGAAASFSRYGQLVIQAGGTVTIKPKPVTTRVTTAATPRVVNVLTAYQAPEPVGPGWPGSLPLRIDSQGNLLVATGVDATKPPRVVAMDINIEEALLSGADPTSLLPPTAATGCVAAGKDAYSISAPDFFDKVVAGSCDTGK